MKRKLYKQFLCLFAIALLATTLKAQNTVVKIAYLEQVMPIPAALSNLDAHLTDETIHRSKLSAKGTASADWNITRRCVSFIGGTRF